MKNCELCQLPARTYCDSDQATLCWGCDFKVHGANFLVARHTRTLLCHACHAPTPWKASGEKLGHTFSLCESCVARNETRGAGGDLESQGGNDDDVYTDSDDLDDEDAEEDDDDDDDGDVDFDEDGDNQVVPWSSTVAPPPAASSSSSEEEVGNHGGRCVAHSNDAVSLKRIRDHASVPLSQIDLNHTFGYVTACTAHSGSDDGATSADSRRPSKDRRLDLNGSGPIGSPRRSFRLNIRNVREGSEAVVDLDSPPEPRIP